MSLIDQFEVQFNELSNSEILEGSLDEIQPVELAGVLQQEISRIQMTVSPSEKVEEINDKYYIGNISNGGLFKDFY